MDLQLMANADPQTAKLLAFGEVGTRQEERLAELVRQGSVRQPVYAYVAGKAALALRLNRPSNRLPCPQHPPSPHPAIPPADQRQSRTVHPDYNHHRPHSAIGREPPITCI
jgi:succinyl-CoA synthetase alpha subunit